MPEPTTDQAGTTANGSGSLEFAQLRDLLVGPEREQLASLEQRLTDPLKRTADLAEVLPAAVRAARGKPLREALEPLLEKAFESSIRKHPKELADAIYPVIGPAIRNSIAASIREFAESLNQIVEKSASLRAIRWRIEARVTGKSFSEILLTRSLLYRVEQVFLIHRKSGLLLEHVAAEESVLKDADMISGMLTAIQDFFSDSFTGEGHDLETVDTGRFKLWIQYGSKAMLVGAVSGTAPAELKGVFRNAIGKIHEIFYAELDAFKQDDLTVFEGTRPMLEACLLGHSAPARRKRRPAIAWLVVAMIVVLAGGLIWYRTSEQARWNNYFDALRRQPGVVVTDIEKRAPGYVIAGMKDPKAPDPAILLGEKGLEARRVRYDWQPFLSLNTPFARERDLEDAKRRIENRLIRFEPDSSKLSLTEADKIMEIVEALRAHPEVRLTLTGRADETGSASSNSMLSEQRTIKVIDAMVARGIAADRLEPVALGDSNPLRTGGMEWDRADNRSVSFRVR